MRNLPAICIAARASGLKQYISGIPCKLGHVVPRYTINNQCSECARISAREWGRKNSEYKRTRARAWQKSNPERVKITANRASWKRQGIKPTRPAPHTCEACGKPEKGARSTYLSADHDHSTGLFRGWLCNKCNRGLGMIGDSLEAVRALAMYLERANYYRMRSHDVLPVRIQPALSRIRS